jgi:16S rRNA (guanine966-N2)-methyltransferase
LRIVSGKYKGRIFHPSKNFKARPTTDLAKESLFNIIANYFDFENIKVLDMFSGTGSISFEFASRGCRDIELVENNLNHLQFIKKVIAELSLTSIKVINYDAFKFLNNNNTKYDIIFCDPPYNNDRIETIPGLVYKNNLLNDNGWLILEHSGKLSFSSHPNLFDNRHYGSVNFSFFKNEK